MLISIVLHDKMDTIFLLFVVMWLESYILIGFLLQKVEAIFLKIIPHIVSKKFVRDLFENEYHSSVNFYADSKSVFEIKRFLISMPLTWGAGGSPDFILQTHTHTHARQIW